MTLIVTVNTPEISLMLGDARLSLVDVDGVFRYDDCCQKVFRLSETTVLGFAGDVLAAADYIGTFAALYRQIDPDRYNHALSIQQLVLSHVLNQARFAEAFRFPDGSLPSIDFVFTGRAHASVPIFQTLHLSLPDGNVELLTQQGITVLGSGKAFFEPIARMLANSLDEFREAATREPDPPHWLAWRILTFVSSMLLLQATREGTLPPASIGTILHGMYVDTDRITSMGSILHAPTDFLGSPLKAAFGGGYRVTFENERFRLRTHRGDDIILLTPPELIAGRRVDGWRGTKQVDP